MTKQIIYGLAAGLLFFGFGCTPKTSEVTSETPSTQEIPPSQGTTEPSPEVRVLDADGEPLPDNTVKTTHVIGKDNCPQKLAPITIDLSPLLDVSFEDWKQPNLDNIPAEDNHIIDVDDISQTDPNVPTFTINSSFNCGVEDFTTHIESSSISFWTRGAGSSDDPTERMHLDWSRPSQDSDIPSESMLIPIVFEMNIMTLSAYQAEQE